MENLTVEMQLYERMKETLERLYANKWILIYGKEFYKIYDSFEEAAGDAVSKFGKGPYLIRQIGVIQTILPSSLLFQLINA